MPALFATDQRRVNTFFDRAIGIFEKHAVKSDQKWMFTYAKCLLQFGSMKFELWKAGGLQFSMAGKADSPELDAMVRDADQHLRGGQDTLVQEFARTVLLVHYLGRCAATLRWWHCRCWCHCKRWCRGCCRSWSAGGPDAFHVDTGAAMPARICLHPVDSIDVRVLQLHAPSDHYYARLQ